MYFATVLLGGCPLAGILYSYSKIVSSIRAIPSAQGKYKAFFTCASHLSVVSLFYGASLGVYLSSAGTHSSQFSATASVMYTVVAPMLNPFIYSLRNRDIKRALKRFFGMAGTKGTITLSLKKWPCFTGPKPQNQKLRFCNQIVGFELAPFISVLEFPVFFSNSLYSLSHHFIKLSTLSVV